MMMLGINLKQAVGLYHNSHIITAEDLFYLNQLMIPKPCCMLDQEIQELSYQSVSFHRLVWSLSN